MDSEVILDYFFKTDIKTMTEDSPSPKSPEIGKIGLPKWVHGFPKRVPGFPYEYPVSKMGYPVL